MSSAQSSEMRANHTVIAETKGLPMDCISPNGTRAKPDILQLDLLLIETCPN